MFSVPLRQDRPDHVVRIRLPNDPEAGAGLCTRPALASTTVPKMKQSFKT